MAAVIHALVIEDEPLIAMMIEDSLLDAGATSVMVAASEREALDLAFARRPDFIASDVNLVEGSGPAAVAAIRARQGITPVLFITAHPELCSEAEPPRTVLTKPFTSGAARSHFRALMGLNS